MTDTSVAADQLRAIVERIENLEAEIKSLNDDKSEVYSEAKANGFDVAILKKLVAERRKPASEREEAEAILELYREALGMPTALVHVHPREGRATRSKARLSESMQDDVELSAEMLRDGLISPESHTENIQIAQAVSNKLGNGRRAA